MPPHNTTPKPQPRFRGTKPPNPTAPKPPPNWPPSIQYLTHPRLSPTLAPSTITHLNLTHTPTPRSPASQPSRLVKITKLTSPSHPAHGQLGLFAARTLPARSFIVDYLGYVHDASDTDETSDYGLSLDAELGVGVDARRMGNEARMVNDYRGVPGFERANVVFETRRVGEGEGEGEGEVRMALWVGSRDVKKGTELCVSYGKGFWKERGKVEVDDGQ